MAEKARRSGVIFRPHFKTHQSAAIGEWFRDEAVQSITVSSLEMAGYFASAGWRDITVAFPLNRRETGLINQLAAQIRLNLLVNDPDTAAYLAGHITSPCNVFIEIDNGYHRSGLEPDRIHEIRSIIQCCQSHPNLSFTGFLSHFGNTYTDGGTPEIPAIYQKGVDDLRFLRERVSSQAGQILVSIGDTPSCSLVDVFRGIDEIRPGNFVFYDVMQAGLGVCSYRDIAVCLAAPVTEVHHERNELVAWAGAVHLSKESTEYKGKRVFGLVTEITESGWSAPLDGCFVKSLSQEHSIIHITSALSGKFRPGNLIGILPVHSCLAAASMRNFLTLTGTQISCMPVS
jgi:D-serine deaminase-like pyridoxal phosphate-dependent protein